MKKVVVYDLSGTIIDEGLIKGPHGLFAVCIRFGKRLIVFDKSSKVSVCGEFRFENLSEFVGVSKKKVKGFNPRTNREIGEAKIISMEDDLITIESNGVEMRFDSESKSGRVPFVDDECRIVIC